MDMPESYFINANVSERVYGERKKCAAYKDLPMRSVSVDH